MKKSQLSSMDTNRVLRPKKEAYNRIEKLAKQKMRSNWKGILATYPGPLCLKTACTSKGLLERTYLRDYGYGPGTTTSNIGV